MDKVLVYTHLSIASTVNPQRQRIPLKSVAYEPVECFGHVLFLVPESFGPDCQGGRHHRVWIRPVIRWLSESNPRQSFCSEPKLRYKLLLIYLRKAFNFQGLLKI
ncbi:hypothetical protein KC19_10G181400 [Ceratodon purpureus]|uniref:Uncharacterized protein n=1 Tax=Ceratodon purpureus TaxID=3225 RepID=A0A8T0GQ93_CERPU|nr:hypothetical protein KC19_10G181400 [Ceratodon purpureus]